MYYYANCGNKIRTDDIAAESTSVAIKDSGNEELGNALLAPEGLLGVGFQPEVETGTEEGGQKLLEAFGQETKQAKPKKVPKKKNEDGSTEKAEPQTLEESMSQFFHILEIIL